MIEFRRASRTVLLTVAFGLALIAGLAAAVPSMAATSTDSWTQQSPATSPPVRERPAMAYDPATGQVVLFGGQGGAGLLDETWTWDGSDWTEQSAAAGPPAREGASLAYDPAIGQMILFGGEHQRVGGDVGFSNETWTWDGTRWTELSPMVSPPTRIDASMAYDAATGQMILFGGLLDNGQNTYDPSDETWAYDGSDWTRQSPTTSPPPRAEASMAYDAATEQMVLFGGSDPGPLGDTWTYDGSTWTRRTPASSPSPRAVPMVYDSATEQTVLFGGTADYLTFFNDTWTYDGSDWTQQLPASSPPARLTEALAYDAATDQVVLFGGNIGEGENDLFDDTWTYGPPAPPPAPVVTPSPAPTSTPTVPVANGPAASTSAPPSPPPKVTFSRGPRHLGKSGAVHYTFRFTDGARGATFECRLDKASFAPCHSPKVYRQLTGGRHVFEVEAISGGVASTARKLKFLVPTLSSRAQ